MRVARKIAEIEKLEFPRISCHTVGRYIPSLCNTAMLTVRRAINLICIFLSCDFYAIVLEKTNQEKYVILSLSDHYFVVVFQNDGQCHIRYSSAEAVGATGTLTKAKPSMIGS